MADRDCPICEWLGGDVEWVHRDDMFAAGVFPGFDVPGWLFLALRRHAEGPMGMGPGEAAAFGPVLVDLTARLQRVTGAERVYVVAYGELFPHWHCLLSPRGADVPPEQRGPSLFLRRAELVDPDAAAEVARQVGGR